MKNEVKENIMWISGIVLLILAAILFLIEADNISIFPGFSAKPHIAAITLTITGIILVSRGRVNHFNR